MHRFVFTRITPQLKLDLLLGSDSTIVEFQLQQQILLQCMQSDDSYLIKPLLPILRFRVVRHYCIYGVRVMQENSGDAAGTLHINTLTRKYPDFTAEEFMIYWAFKHCMILGSIWMISAKSKSGESKRIFGYRDVKFLIDKLRSRAFCVYREL
ncbi:hypothetical protein C1646_673397 [Rhizophagus diaphanus]|nr:hypothetical protein C1646_673397 [Rhizophagus diaphanus] [Rhizophagus sp. MUCL 43196]